MKKKGLSLLLALLMVVSVFSPAFPTLGGILASAASSYPVELAFNNLFVFEEWARNKLSTTVMPRNEADVDKPYGTLDNIDVENGSFRLTKTNMDVGEIFTAFGMDATNALNNTGYYIMEVEPNTTYNFDYHVTGTIWSFTPYVFMFDSNNLYQTLVAYPTPAYNENSFSFTTPENVTKIQIRFTIGDTSTSRPDMSSVYADVKDIAIYKVETIYPDNLFDYDAWAGNTSSNTESAMFGSGTVDNNSEDKSITLTSSGVDNGAAFGIVSSIIFTGMNLGASDGFYTIDVDPSTTYTITCTLAENNLPDANWFSIYIIEHNSSGGMITYNIATKTSNNTYTYTTNASTDHVQIAFSVYDYGLVNGTYATVKDIAFYEASGIKDISHKTTPIRKVYTYGADETYTDLPTPSYIPDGYVFAGWFTEPDGEGERITENTPVTYKSFTVYAKYEVAVDTLEVASTPTKVVYTKGEKLNTAGLSLKATVSSQADTDGDGVLDNVTRTFNINSGIYCTPETLNTVGTQTITAHYGGKTATFQVTVLENDTTDVVVNGVVMDTIAVANNKYTINASANAFNRYRITYSSDSHVRGLITFDNGFTEEFFLEPSDNETFVSLIDGFLDGTTRNKIVSVEFTSLDKDFGNVQLKAVTTDFKDVPADTVYYNNAEYEMGIALNYGGVVSELYDIDDNVTSRVYNTTYDNGEQTYARTITKVDYADKLESGYIEESKKVNLINTYDRGRYLQQSYYGTFDRPYETGWYNSTDWNYNPVQGGNVVGEASKVIDYEITENYVYVKARPLDWAKWSDEFAENDTSVDRNGEKVYEPIWGDSYVTDTYVEAWYYFSDGMIKVVNRKIDYSGLPEYFTTQEYPAFYTIEPLNNFVYNDVSEAEAWSVKNYENDLEPEFWGIINSYKEYHGLEDFQPSVTSNENWAAFTASEDEDSFGIGIYSPGVTDFYYGVMPQVYAQNADLATGEILGETDILNYRHAENVDPAPELPTSYIAPIGESTFRSYEATEYTYYLSTGTTEEIQHDFSLVGDREAAEKLAETKIAVPETVYLNPANNQNGQYYVNNVLNENDYYNVETVAESAQTDMYLGIHVKDAISFKATVTNVTDADNDIILGDGSGSGNREGETISFDSSLNDSVIIDGGLSLRLTNGLSPGEKVTAKWEIAVTLSNGTTETHTVYTVLYAPGRTVGAVAEGRYDGSANSEISSWITGANGVDHSQRAPLGSFHGDYHDSGYFKMDPLAYPDTLPTGGSSQSEDDYIYTTDANGITGDDTSVDYTDNSYVLQTATDGSDGSRSQSYLGLLTVDKSRYTNTNQIPNLKIGFDALRVGSNDKDSLRTYNTYYTLGTVESYTATSLSEAPSGWTQYSSYTDFVNSHTPPYRETVVPEYDVSDIDGKYIHALNQGQSVNMINSSGRYATAGTSVLCSVTDKSGLRDAVLEGYANTNTDPEFIEKLENAATVLGDPSATQDEIDKAKQDLNENVTTNYYSLKFDNLFSAYEFSQHSTSMIASRGIGSVAYENGKITVTSEANKEPGEEYTAYNHYNSVDGVYKVALQPNTEYVFEFDVETNTNAQALLFLYNSEGGAGEVPANVYMKTNDGDWVAKTESNSWTGPYGVSTGKYAVKFTTGATTVAAGFRFGNKSNDATTSTFSNIKLIESSKYYEDVEYEKTEDVFQEYMAYGTLQTLERTGYTFNGWADVNGNTVTGAELATEHKTIYSQWDEHSYTIKYNANGGSGSVADKTVKYSESVTLPSTGLTNGDLLFVGWSTDKNATTADYQPGQTVSKLTATDGATVTLYAVWFEVGPQNVTFDNLIDISAWTKSANNVQVKDVTDTGFTVVADGTGEATSESDYFVVQAGNRYVVEADIKGDNWDIYFFFCDANGNWVGFTDAGSRLASGGYNQTTDGIHVTSIEFTAPEGAVKAYIRVDSNNGGGNVVRFENIRVQDVTTYTTYLETVNKYVEYKDTYGKLPVPVREGQTFLGWVDENGNKVTEDTVMNSTSTVFLKSTWTTNPNTVNNDTVVIEYGIPVVINVLANDKATSVSGIGTKGVSDADLGSRSFASGILTDKADSITLANGNVTLNGDGTITYTLTKTNVTVEESFYYEAVAGDGTYYYAKVTVIPATTLYFEDTFFEFENSTVTKNGKTYNYNWEELGTSVSGVFQSADRPGAFNFEDDANNVYGYDSSFDSKVAYSGGTAHYVEVDQIAGSKVPKAKFTFTGTGFDLFSVTDAKSGTVTVTIYRGTEIDSSKRVQGIMANAYFGYSYDETADEYVPADNGAIFQVPVIRARDLGYDTYTVVVEPRYNKTFDVASTGKAGVYVDSVRIYDPMGEANAVANEAYKADGEYAPQYLEIRDTLVKSKGDGTFDVTDLGESTSVFLDGGKTSLEDFAKLGPKNEVYLANGDAVTFHIVTDRAELPSTVQLGMRITGKGGSSADVKLMNTDYDNWVETFTLNSATERFYNVEAVVDWVEQPDGTYKTAAPVVIKNTSDAIVSLTSLKWTFSDGEEALTVLDLVTDEMTPKLAMAAIMRADNPAPTTQDTILNKDNISYEFTGEPYALGDTGVLTIITEQGVSGVTVNGTEVFDCVVNGDGKLEWTFEFDVDSTGSVVFEIFANDENGFTSESIYATTNVEDDTQNDEGDTTAPDGDESEDTDGSSGNGNAAGNPASFVETLLNGIFNIIKKILGLFLGGVTV